MTEIISFECPKCNKKYGPFDLHGFKKETASGERLIICETCFDIKVGKFENGQLKGSFKCDKCNNDYKLFKLKCPKCQTQLKTNKKLP